MGNLITIDFLNFNIGSLEKLTFSFWTGFAALITIILLLFVSTSR